MTREMNKPDWDLLSYCPTYKRMMSLWHCENICKKCFGKPQEPVLDEWIKPFFDNCCRMEKIKR